MHKMCTLTSNFMQLVDNFHLTFYIEPNFKEMEGLMIGETRRADAYMLQTGEKGNKRLEILNELMNPGFLIFLKDSGLKEGMTVLDIGCGTGILACKIAELVGPNGHVIGVDISKEQIELSQNLAEQLKVKNVKFRQLSAYDIGQFTEKFDIIYTHFVLCHLKEPEKVIKIAHSILSPNGVMVSSEIADWENFSCVPQQDGYDYWVSAVEPQRRLQGSIESFETKLHGLFFENGLIPFSRHTFAHGLVTKRQKKLLRLGLQETKQKLLDIGFTTENEFDKAIQQLRLFEKDDHYCAYYSKCVRIAATPKKPNN